MQPLRALLETTSTPKNNITVYLQKHAMVTSSLPQKPVLPEPQNNPYWLMKRQGSISKCRGYKKELGEIILAVLDLDCFLKQIMLKKQNIYQTKYYHLLINCLGKRGPGLSLSPRDVKVDSSTKVDEKLQSMLFSSFCCQPVSKEHE